MSPNPPAEVRAGTVEVLARTLWGEGGGQPVRGLEALAALVLHRVAIARRPGGCWWGDTIAAVCRQPLQFGCWNAAGPGHARMLAVGPGEPMFDACLRIARRAVSGLVPDPTNGATHFHRSGGYPDWARGRAPCAEIGDLLFYRLDPPLQA